MSQPPSPAFTLDVQTPQEERQIRRLGAAVCLLWPSLPHDIQAAITSYAARIEISGESVPAADLKIRLLSFLTDAGPKLRVRETDETEDADASGREVLSRRLRALNGEADA